MQALSNDELERLLRAARTFRTRDWLMILVAYWHGLRASEVVALTTTSIKDGQLTVQRLKGSLRTVQPLIDHPDALFNERRGLAKFTEEMCSGDRLFPVTRERFHQIMRQHCKAADIPQSKAHPHVLKHTIAMNLIDKIGINYVQRYLGHKEGSSTLEYMKVSDEEAARAVLGTLPI